MTQQGKVRSSANALTHGLLAKLFTPPGDLRRHDRLHRQLIEQLTDEFKPQTFTEEIIIAQLARDFLQLGRASGMVESLQKPYIGEGLSNRYQQLKADRRILRQMKSIRDQIDAGEAFSCAVDIADRIAERVGTYIAHVRAEATCKDAIPVEQMDAFEREEDEDLKSQWAGLRPFNTKLTDCRHLSAVLTGREKETPGALKQLRNVLESCIRAVREKVERAGNVRQSVEDACRERVDQLANEPDKLILHQLYASRIERSIKRKIAELNRR